MTYRVRVDKDGYPIECDSVEEVLNLLKVLSPSTFPREKLDYYVSSLYHWIVATDTRRDAASVNAIRSLWNGEDWDSIMRKLNTEGSAWVVWWMDGVRKYMLNDLANVRTADELQTR